MNFFKMVRDEARREKELIERKEVYYSDIKSNIIEYIELWTRLNLKYRDLPVVSRSVINYLPSK